MTASNDKRNRLRFGGLGMNSKYSIISIMSDDNEFSNFVIDALIGEGSVLGNEYSIERGEGDNTRGVNEILTLVFSGIAALESLLNITGLDKFIQERIDNYIVKYKRVPSCKKNNSNLDTVPKIDVTVELPSGDIITISVSISLRKYK